MRLNTSPARVFRLSLLVTAFIITSPLPLTSVIPTGNQAHAAAPITTSGLNTQVSQPVTLPTGQTQYNITGGTRPGGGTNLFHSFGDFNVPTNNIANFFNETGLSTSNILGRVTGGNISNIFGTIQTTNFGAANLFLMNPAGFLFGPNATVNVGGMVAFTTSDYLRLADGVRFNAVPDVAADALLSAAPVVAFGFLGSNPAAINFEGGQLTVANGTGLALVGGNITLIPDSSGTPSSITAPGRPILLTSVAGSGEVAADTGTPAPGMALGTVTLGQGTTLSTASDLSFGDGSGGAISIRGGQLVVTGATILTNPAFGTTGQGGEVTITASDTASFTDSFISTSSLFAGSGGAVTITAGNSVTLTGSTIVTFSLLSSGDGGAVNITAPIVALEDTGIATSFNGDGTTSGSGGAVTLGGNQTTSVSLTRSSIDTSASNTAGNAGPVTIAGSTVTIVGNQGDVTIKTITHNDMGDPNAGNGGDITITGTNVTLTDSASLASVADAPGASSRGGNIRISGSENIVLNNGAVLQTTTNSQGAAGNIELLGQHVTITQSSLFSATFSSSGAGGAITITGSGDVALNSGTLISTTAALDPGTEGAAGPITISTPHLTITGGSQVASDTFGSGPGGTVTVQGTSGPAQSVLISDPGSGIFTDTTTTNFFGPNVGTGTGGNIFVNANSVTLQNGGMLSAKTTGVGNAGNILVKADSVNLESGAQFTSSSSVRQTPFFEGEVIPSPTGNAGNVTIQGLASPAQSVLIDGAGSGIFTNTEGTGAGGNIFVNANSVTMTNGATMSASSTGQIEHPGNAGSIDLTATNGLMMQNSTITTQAAQGAGGGNIKITTSPAATVYLQDSLISASVADGPGGGGNVSIDPQFVILQNSKILAQADQGQGGNISIIAGLFVQDANSLVNADSGRGVNGTVTIQSPISPASGKIVPLSQKPLIPTSLLSQRCAALARGNFSSFTVAGRDTLPAEPGGWLSSPLAALNAGTGQEVRGEGNGGREAEGERREAGGDDEMPILSLRQIAPPGFLTQAFAVDGSAGCQS